MKLSGNWSVLYILAVVSFVWTPGSCAQTTPQARSSPSIEVSPSSFQTPDEEAAARYWQERGFRYARSQRGTIFSISEASIRSAYQAACEGRTTSPPCDQLPHYQQRVEIDDWANLFFLHRDGPGTNYVPAFACSKIGAEWRCQVEQP